MKFAFISFEEKFEEKEPVYQSIMNFTIPDVFKWSSSIISNLKHRRLLLLFVLRSMYDGLLMMFIIYPLNSKLHILKLILLVLSSVWNKTLRIFSRMENPPLSNKESLIYFDLLSGTHSRYSSRYHRARYPIKKSINSEQVSLGLETIKMKFTKH